MKFNHHRSAASNNSTQNDGVMRKFDACLHFKQQFISLNEQFKILNGDEKAMEFRGVITLKTQFCPHQAGLLADRSSVCGGGGE